MKKILIDTNVVLDYLLQRDNYFNSQTIYVMAEKRVIEGYISASAITDIFFLAQKRLGKNPTKDALKKFLLVFKPATVTDKHIYQALDFDWSDFEDSVQYVVGESFSADCIVTRNTQDYSYGTIPVLTPEQFVQANMVIE